MRKLIKPLSLLMASFMLLAFPYPVSAGLENGTGLTKLVENASIPVWSPNGDEILFTRNNAETLGDPYYGWDIYKINPEDPKAIQLTNFYYNEGDHVWSPDGTRILYSYDAVDDFYLYIMNSDGSENFELTKQSYGENFSGISGGVWAPDGSKIAYISHELNGSDRLITLNPDGSNESLTASAAEISALAWAPDSSRIAFKAAYSEEEEKSGIYLTNSDGSEQLFLAEGNIRQQIQPWQAEVWSENGSKILYSSNENGNSEIYSINTDGSEKKQLTDNVSEDYSPCFSPNGSKIIFISNRNGYDNLWIMDADGNNEEELTKDFESISEFSWSPDGQKTAFSSNFETYIQEISYAGTDDGGPSEDPGSDIDDDLDYLNLEILSPGLNFAAIEGTPELITVNLTNSSGSPVQSSGFKSIRANFSNGDPELQLFDDGTHWDTAANDGIFSNRWTPVNTSESSTFCILRVSADHETLGSAEQIISGTISRLPTPPDLVIENISWDPANPYENDNITFRLTFANQGTGASEACTAKCYINGSEVYTYSLQGLEAGSNTSITFNWVPAVSGNLDIKVVVDTENKVSESEEENNEKEVTLSVQTVTSSSSTSTSTSSESRHKSSSGSSGGGTGGSPEPASNVRIKELSQQYITNGKHVQFTFPKNVTCITYVAFDSKRTTGKTTTIVEMLKKKSTLVSELSSGEVYEYINIWVGNKGTANPENIENAVIGFRIEKTWLNSSDADSASVILWRFSNENWEELSTRQAGEDDTYIYFEAKTPGFSSFAITALPEVNETVEETEELSIVPSVRGADVMGALFGKLPGKQNSSILELSTMAVNESSSNVEGSATASKAGEQIARRDILRILVVIALLSVTGFLGSLILRKQN